MSDAFTLEDGRSWWASNRMWSAVAARIAAAATGAAPDDAFGPWLTDRVENGINGASGFDLRGLPPAARATFWRGAVAAYAALVDGGDAGFGDAEVFARVVEHFGLLLRMHDAVVAGEDPRVIDPAAVVLDWDGDAIDLQERVLPH